MFESLILLGTACGYGGGGRRGWGECSGGGGAAVDT